MRLLAAVLAVTALGECEILSCKHLGGLSQHVCVNSLQDKYTSRSRGSVRCGLPLTLYD